MEAREWGGDHADQASLGQAYSILGRSVLARRLAGHFLLLLSTVAIPVINTMTIRMQVLVCLRGNSTLDTN